MPSAPRWDLSANSRTAQTMANPNRTKYSWRRAGADPPTTAGESAAGESTVVTMILSGCGEGGKRDAAGDAIGFARTKVSDAGPPKPLAIQNVLLPFSMATPPFLVKAERSFLPPSPAPVVVVGQRVVDGHDTGIDRCQTTRAEQLPEDDLLVDIDRRVVPDVGTCLAGCPLAASQSVDEPA